MPITYGVKNKDTSNHLQKVSFLQIRIAKL